MACEIPPQKISHFVYKLQMLTKFHKMSARTRYRWSVHIRKTEQFSENQFKWSWVTLTTHSSLFHPILPG